MMSHLHFYGVALSWETKDGVVEVKLHHGACNEIGMTMLSELEQLADFVEAGAGGAGALIFYSDRPKGFSAGADLAQLYRGMKGEVIPGMPGFDKLAGSNEGSGIRSWLLQAAAKGGETLFRPLFFREVRRFLVRIHRAFRVLDEAPLLTIAATHGVVFGGGFELALTADIIVAEKNSRFAFPETRLGIIPGFGGIPRLERDVGNAVVRDLLLTGRSLRAKRAHEIGLVSQLVAKDARLDVARKLAAQALRFDGDTVAASKRFLKPVPAERLEAEIDLFCEMLRSPVVERALHKFVTSTDVRPYLA